MKRAYFWVGLVAVIAVGCWEEGEDVDVLHSTAEHDDLSWSAAGVSDLTVSTLYGNIEVRIDDKISDIHALVDRVCVSSKDRDDAKAHVGDVTVSGSQSGEVFTIAAEMPGSEERTYYANLLVGTPVFERVELETGEGHVRIDAPVADGTIEAWVGSGDIRCKIGELRAGSWVVLRTNNGYPQLWIPADASVVFDIRAVNGTAYIEEFDSVTYTADEEYRKAGYLGDGDGAIVFVEVEMGNVFLNVLEENYFDTH